MRNYNRGLGQLPPDQRSHRPGGADDGNNHGGSGRPEMRGAREVPNHPRYRPNESGPSQMPYRGRPFTGARSSNRAPSYMSSRSWEALRHCLQPQQLAEFDFYKLTGIWSSTHDTPIPVEMLNELANAFPDIVARDRSKVNSQTLNQWMLGIREAEFNRYDAGNAVNTLLGHTAGLFYPEGAGVNLPMPQISFGTLSLAFNNLKHINPTDAIAPGLKRLIAALTAQLRAAELDGRWLDAKSFGGSMGGIVRFAKNDQLQPEIHNAFAALSTHIWKDLDNRLDEDRHGGVSFSSLTVNWGNENVPPPPFTTLKKLAEALPEIVAYSPRDVTCKTFSQWILGLRKTMLALELYSESTDEVQLQSNFISLESSAEAAKSEVINTLLLSTAEILAPQHPCLSAFKFTADNLVISQAINNLKCVEAGPRTEVGLKKMMGALALQLRQLEENQRPLDQSQVAISMKGLKHLEDNEHLKSALTDLLEALGANVWTSLDQQLSRYGAKGVGFDDLTVNLSKEGFPPPPARTLENIEKNLETIVWRTPAKLTARTLDQWFLGLEKIGPKLGSHRDLLNKILIHSADLIDLRNVDKAQRIPDLDIQVINAGFNCLKHIEHREETETGLAKLLEALSFQLRHCAANHQWMNAGNIAKGMNGLQNLSPTKMLAPALGSALAAFSLHIKQAENSGDWLSPAQFAGVFIGVKAIGNHFSQIEPHLTALLNAVIPHIEEAWKNENWLNAKTLTTVFANLLYFHNTPGLLPALNSLFLALEPHLTHDRRVENDSVISAQGISASLLGMLFITGGTELDTVIDRLLDSFAKHMDEATARNDWLQHNYATSLLQGVRGLRPTNALGRLLSATARNVRAIPGNKWQGITDEEKRCLLAESLVALRTSLSSGEESATEGAYGLLSELYAAVDIEPVPSRAQLSDGVPTLVHALLQSLAVIERTSETDIIDIVHSLRVRSRTAAVFWEEHLTQYANDPRNTRRQCLIFGRSSHSPVLSSAGLQRRALENLCILFPQLSWEWKSGSVVVGKATPQSRVGKRHLGPDVPGAPRAPKALRPSDDSSAIRR